MTLVELYGKGSVGHAVESWEKFVRWLTPDEEGIQISLKLPCLV